MARMYIKPFRRRDLLDIAMETDGAYVPAGTGALDLDSIYRNHIETLLTGTLDSQQQVIRNETFQWFVLSAIILLIMALASSTSWNLKTGALAAADTIASQSSAATIGPLVLLIMTMSAPSVQAQSTGKNSDPASLPSPAPPALQAPGGELTEPAADSFDESLPPRTIYNQSLAFVHGDPDRAERYLNHARREAGSDGELRFRALYNLGWVEINRADAALEADPQQALQFLQQAANRFREAIRVRPEDQSARQNLEIISRRILQLTDALRAKEPQDLATRLDAIIVHTREHQGELQALVQEVAHDDDHLTVDSYRSNYRRLAVTQRELISDVQQFADDARAELDAITTKADDEKTPEDKLRTVQLGNMFRFVDNSIQRMNKSRSLTRRLQGDGAFRRWSSALSDLKRTRDQLRNPVEVLGQIIADATEMAGLTRRLSTDKIPLPAEAASELAPAWLTKDYVADLLGTTTERTTELAEGFTRITTAQETAKDPLNGAASSEASDPRTAQLLKNIEAATPMVHRASDLFEQSRTELEENAIDLAQQKQVDALSQLSSAWELFFDIRRLIELIYSHQQLARNLVDQSTNRPELLAS